MNREKLQVLLALTRTCLLLVVFASVSNGDGFAQGIETFDVPNSTQTHPTAINAAGQITGYYFGQDNSYHGFLRERDGTIISFDAPGGADPFHGIRPLAINAPGQIVGFYDLHDFNDANTGFLRERDGTIISFGPVPSAINDAGQIVGEGFLREPNGTITVIED